MRILYYDCFCGISGDMNLAALVDLGVPFDYLNTELKKLKMKDEFSLIKKKDNKQGIEGVKIDVILENKNTHHHRTFTDIKEIIDESDLSLNVKNNAKKIFLEIAIAEAKVHGKTVEEIHFHEVGAVDSIVDVVGASICLDYLNVDAIYASSVQLGGGFVNCEHGKMPVPAPATAEILKNIPTKRGLVNFETTTPTGAGILKAMVSKFSDTLEFIPVKIGYGLGTKNFEVPNILRVYIAETSDDEFRNVRKQYIMETNIDDMNSELYSFTESLLYKNGALDVYKTPIIMKKGRPAVKLSILFENANRLNIQKVIFENTTTAGIREYEVDKYMLKRDFSNVVTKYGSVKVKNLYYNDKLLISKPEYEDCKNIAFEYMLKISDVYNLVMKELENAKI